MENILDSVYFQFSSRQLSILEFFLDDETKPIFFSSIEQLEDIVGLLLVRTGNGLSLINEVEVGANYVRLRTKLSEEEKEALHQLAQLSNFIPYHVKTYAVLKEFIKEKSLIIKRRREEVGKLLDTSSRLKNSYFKTRLNSRVNPNMNGEAFVVIDEVKRGQFLLELDISKHPYRESIERIFNES